MTDLVAVVDAGPGAAASLPTINSLLRAHPGLTVLAAGTSDTLIQDAGAIPVPGPLGLAAWAAFEERRCHVLVVARPAVFPANALLPGLAIIEQDIRVATVSFLASAASFLSFPCQSGFDEEMVTRRLRTLSPEQLPVPIPFATGPAVLLSAYALSAVGALSDGEDALVTAADFSLRARRRGFFDVLDPSTFCTRLIDVGVPDDGDLMARLDAGLDRASAAEARELKVESDIETSPLTVAHRVARTKALGLRLLVDGSCFGPSQMGTQVQALSLITALARRDDVAHISVPLVMSLPPYAEPLLADPKITARVVYGGDLAGFPAVDVAHRPFQPDGLIGMEALQQVSARSVLTILDLIAYHGRSYHPAGDAWMAYRARIAEGVGTADGIVVLSEEVAHHIRLERLVVDDGRLFVVPLGTDHLAAGDEMVIPAELVARQALTDQFILVLGTNYAHKNRDLAVGAVRELRRRGYPHSLVMVGTSVFGSSRVLEAVASVGLDGIVVIPDTSSQERNWLLRHASLVLYPSSAEGYGLVPFEAASFGTPTVIVPAGPLRRVATRLPVVASDWSPETLADAAEELLADPAVAAAQVQATLGAGADHTWDGVAAALVDVYRSVLARPSVRLPSSVRAQ